MSIKRILKTLAEKTYLIFFWKVYKTLRTQGFESASNYVKHTFYILFSSKKRREEDLDKIISEIFSENKNKTVILSLSLIDWSVPLFQRPHHIAREISSRNILYFYNTRNYYDYVEGVKEIKPNLFLTNKFDEIIDKIQSKRKYIHIYSTNMYPEDDARIDLAIKKGFKIIYEYIDEISESISGYKIPSFVYKRHKKLLKDEKNCIVIATADKLFKDVLKYRKTNCKLITNGVDVNNFIKIKDVIPKEMKRIVDNKKPIIGYYGALAKWFDYKLIADMAKNHSEYNYLLIGWNYDGSLKESKLQCLKNVYILPPVQYQQLPQYAQFFDICIIPFIINEVTKSTSPVKLFEYMALGKPIVTTSIPECKKYKSVYIAKSDPEDFIKKIEIAIKNNNNDYQKILKTEALQNDWSAKADEIIKMIN